MQSDCEALNRYPRAYLHHLVKSGELLGMMILSWANIAYYQSLMASMREAIAKERFGAFRAEVKAGWGDDRRLGQS